MSDHPTSGPGDAPEPGELQLRKVLSTMNDLEPPRDDLFAQRALLRGRARASRRRSAVFGAAAAVLVVGVVGGSWVATHEPSSSSVSAGSAAQNAKGSSAGGPAGESLRSAPSAGAGAAPSVPSARDTTRWFGTLSTVQTNTFDAIEPTVASRWPAVFSGAYAVTSAGDRIAVAVTRHDPGLEGFVTGSMPSPADVEFVVKKHPFAQKLQVAQQIIDQRALWHSKGVEILGVAQDGRSDQVVVVARGTSAALLGRQYGNLVRVVPPAQDAPGKLPDGSTLPPLQR